MRSSPSPVRRPASMPLIAADLFSEISSRWLFRPRYFDVEQLVDGHFHSANVGPHFDLVALSCRRREYGRADSCRRISPIATNIRAPMCAKLSFGRQFSSAPSRRSNIVISCEWRDAHALPIYQEAQFIKRRRPVGRQSKQAWRHRSAHTREAPSSFNPPVCWLSHHHLQSQPKYCMPIVAASFKACCLSVLFLCLAA